MSGVCAGWSAVHLSALGAASQSPFRQLPKSLKDKKQADTSHISELVYHFLNHLARIENTLQFLYSRSKTMKTNVSEAMNLRSTTKPIVKI